MEFTPFMNVLWLREKGRVNYTIIIMKLIAELKIVLPQM